MNRRIWIILSVCLIVLSLGLRMYHLADRPYHHDESLHAFYSWVLMEEGEYRYNPMLHGPFLFYTNSVVFKVLGDSDWTGRLLPVLLGTGLVVLILGMSPWLGRWGALSAALMMAISPSFLYFSRFLRNDIYICFWWVSILVCLLRFFRNKNPLWFYPIMALIALSFGTKENTWFVGFSFVSFGVMWWVIQHWAKKDYLESIKTFIVQYWKHLLGACVVFWVIYMPLFTVFFKYPGDWNGFATGIKYWLAQHQENRIGAPWWYYLPLLGIYEFLAVIGAGAGLIWLRKYRIKQTLPLFLGWWALTGLILYGWAGEKVPWLMLHIALPMILITGWWIGRLIEGDYWMTLILLFPLFTQTVHSTVMANYLYPAIRPDLIPKQPKAELISYVQTTYDVPELVKEIQRLKIGKPKEYPLTILVTGEAAWPLQWYLRGDKQVSYADEIGFNTPSHDVVIGDFSSYEVDISLLGYRYYPKVYHLRAWWPQRSMRSDTGIIPAVRELAQKAGLRDIARYAIYRDIYETPGSTKVILWERR